MKAAWILAVVVLLFPATNAQVGTLIFKFRECKTSTPHWNKFKFTFIKVQVRPKRNLVLKKWNVFTALSFQLIISVSTNGNLLKVERLGFRESGGLSNRLPIRIFSFLYVFYSKKPNSQQTGAS